MDCKLKKKKINFDKFVAYILRFFFKYIFKNGFLLVLFCQNVEAQREITVLTKTLGSNKQFVCFLISYGEEVMFGLNSSDVLLCQHH